MGDDGHSAVLNVIPIKYTTILSQKHRVHFSEFCKPRSKMKLIAQLKSLTADASKTCVKMTGSGAGLEVEWNQVASNNTQFGVRLLRPKIL